MPEAYSGQERVAPSDTDPVEQYYFSMSVFSGTQPALSARVQHMLFMSEFKYSVTNLVRALRLVSRAANHLQRCRPLLRACQHLTSSIEASIAASPSAQLKIDPEQAASAFVTALGPRDKAMLQCVLDIPGRLMSKVARVREEAIHQTIKQ